MLDVLVADLRTGRRLVPLPASSVDLEALRNTADGITATITLADPMHRRLDLRNTAGVEKSMLAVFDGGHCLGSCMIDEHDYDEDAATLKVQGPGAWDLLNRRFIMPPNVQGTPLLIQSGEDEGEPNPAVATVFQGKTWPQIVRGLVEQSFLRPGGDLPFTFGPDGVGAHNKSYDASAFKTIGSALTDLTELDDGPEIQIETRLQEDGGGLEWRIRVGDDANLRLSSGARHRFDFSAKRKTVKGFKVKASGANLTSEAWVTGGRAEARALISVARSSHLTDLGYPRYESVSSDHSNVVEQGTLDSYARADLALGQNPLEWWTFQSDMDQAPRIGTYSIGDSATVVLKDNGYGIPDGEHDRRIAGIKVDRASRWATITTDEEFATNG